MNFSSKPVATIINFCSNDYPFLKHCIEKVRPFSRQIIVPVCDHFFDGVPEDPALLRRMYAEHPDVLFVQFPFDPSRKEYAYYGNAYWHNIARLVGAHYLEKDVDYVLFLDCDEIVETERFFAWLGHFPYRDYTALRFATYWYFREPTLRALAWEDMPLLVRRELISGDFLMKPLQRSGMYDDAPGKSVRMRTGLDHLPLFHHYSFVRTRAQMLRKVSAWGHNRDREWIPEVEQEFSGAFRGKDFVRGYGFQTVSSYAPIDLDAVPGEAEREGIILSGSDVYRIEIALTWG